GASRSHPNSRRGSAQGTFRYNRDDSTSGEITKMKRKAIFAMLAMAAVSAAFAQAPKGWKMRVDRSTSASDPDGTGNISFVTMGSGFHATNPQAAVYWNPAN